MAKTKQTKKKLQETAKDIAGLLRQTQRAERLREYARAHLGEVCRDFVGVQDILLDSRLHPRDEPITPEHKTRLELLRKEKLLYIRRVINDLFQ